MFTDTPSPLPDSPAPSDAVRDERERRIFLAEYGDGPCEGERQRLTAMYDDYDPADRAQGLPPLAAAARDRWLDTVAEGLNVLAWHEGRVAGHAALLADERGNYELVIFIDRIYRGAGVGSALLSALLIAHGERGGGRVCLSVEPANEAAIGLYRKFGFEVVGRTPMEVEMAREA